MPTTFSGTIEFAADTAAAPVPIPTTTTLLNSVLSRLPSWMSSSHLAVGLLSAIAGYVANLQPAPAPTPTATNPSATVTAQPAPTPKNFSVASKPAAIGDLYATLILDRKATPDQLKFGDSLGKALEPYNASVASYYSDEAEIKAHNLTAYTTTLPMLVIQELAHKTDARAPVIYQTTSTSLDRVVADVRQLRGFE